MSLNTNYAINKPTIKQITYFKTIISKMLPLPEAKKILSNLIHRFYKYAYISSFDNLDLFYRYLFVAWLFVFFIRFFFSR